MLTGESVPVVKKPGDTLYPVLLSQPAPAMPRQDRQAPITTLPSWLKKARTKRRATSEMQNTINRIIRLVSYAILPIGIALFCIQYYHSGSTPFCRPGGHRSRCSWHDPGRTGSSYQRLFHPRRGTPGPEKALVQEMESIEALARVNVPLSGQDRHHHNRKSHCRRSSPLTPYADESVENLLGALVYAFDETNATSQALRRYFAPNPSYGILEKSL